MIIDFLEEFITKSIYVLYFEKLKHYLKIISSCVFILYLLLFKFYNYIFAFIFFVFSLGIVFIVSILICTVKILKLNYKKVTFDSVKYIRQKDTNLMFSLIEKYRFNSNICSIREYIQKQLNTYQKEKTSKSINIVFQVLTIIISVLLSYWSQRDIYIALYIGFFVIGIIIFINIIKYDFSFWFSNKEDKIEQLDYIDDLLLESSVHFSIR